MITYPLNKLEYQAEDAELFHCTRSSGIFAGDHFQYSVSGADNNMIIGQGIGWIKNGVFAGKVFANKEDTLLDLGLPDASLPRIDVVAIQFDKAANATSIIHKTGTAASTPQLPQITQTETLYELFLYKIYRPAGATAVSSAEITDLRLDESVCGLMADSVTKVDTSAINAQIMALIHRLERELAEVESGSGMMMKSVYDPQGRGEDIFHALDAGKVYSLLHTKEGTRHTLTGLPEQSGVFTGQFAASADFCSGDTFDTYTAKPMGEESILPDKAFVSGDLVSVIIDTVNKKLGFRLGGGGDRFSTLPPPISMLTAEGGDGQVTVSFETLSEEYTDLLGEPAYILVLKQGSIPQTPSDGIAVKFDKTGALM